MRGYWTCGRQSGPRVDGKTSALIPPCRYIYFNGRYQIARINDAIVIPVNWREREYHAYSHPSNPNYRASGIRSVMDLDFILNYRTPEYIYRNGVFVRNQSEECAWHFVGTIIYDWFDYFSEINSDGEGVLYEHWEETVPIKLIDIISSSGKAIMKQNKHYGSTKFTSAWSPSEQFVTRMPDEVPAYGDTGDIQPIASPDVAQLSPGVEWLDGTNWKPSLITDGVRDPISLRIQSPLFMSTVTKPESFSRVPYTNARISVETTVYYPLTLFFHLSEAGAGVPHSVYGVKDLYDLTTYPWSVPITPYDTFYPYSIHTRTHTDSTTGIVTTFNNVRRQTYTLYLQAYPVI